MKKCNKDPEWSGSDPKYDHPKTGKKRGRPAESTNKKPAKGRAEANRKYNAKRKPRAQYWKERTIKMKEKAFTVAGHLVTYDAYLAGFIDSHNASLGVFGLDR